MNKTIVFILSYYFMLAISFSPGKIVQYLQRGDPMLFTYLHLLPLQKTKKKLYVTTTLLSGLSFPGSGALFPLQESHLSHLQL